MVRFRAYIGGFWVRMNNIGGNLWRELKGIKRKISFRTKSKDGTKSWETFFTIMDTCRKLGINFRKYLHDKISNKNKMPPLASLIPDIS